MSTKKTAVQNRKIGLTTGVSLNQTRPAKLSKIVRLQRKLNPPVPALPVHSEKKKHPAQPAPQLQQNRRAQPVSQIAKLEKALFWFWPSRIAFALIGLYTLAYSVMSALTVLNSFNLISTPFLLPFEPTFATMLLLQAVATFTLMTAVFSFYAMARPYKFKFLYYFMLLVFLPATFITDYARLQLQTPVSFEYYLYFDIIAVSFFWFTMLLSLPAFLQYPRLLRKIKLSQK